MYLKIILVSNEVEFETKVNAILNQAQEEAGKIGRKSLEADNRFVIMVMRVLGSLNIAQMISCLGAKCQRKTHSLWIFKQNSSSLFQV